MQRPGRGAPQLKTDNTHFLFGRGTLRLFFRRRGRLVSIRMHESLAHPMLWNAPHAGRTSLHVHSPPATLAVKMPRRNRGNKNKPCDDKKDY
jgi:hypothetical protein